MVVWMLKPDQVRLLSVPVTGDFSMSVYLYKQHYTATVLCFQFNHYLLISCHGRESHNCPQHTDASYLLTSQLVVIFITKCIRCLHYCN